MTDSGNDGGVRVAERVRGQGDRAVAGVVGGDVAVEEDGFERRWRGVPGSEQELRETLLRDERFASLVIGSDGPLTELVGRRQAEIELPGATLVALVHRGDDTFVPTPETTFEYGDRITVVGPPTDVSELLGRR